MKQSNNNDWVPRAVSYAEKEWNGKYASGVRKVDDETFGYSIFEINLLENALAEAYMNDSLTLRLPKQEYVDVLFGLDGKVRSVEIVESGLIFNLSKLYNPYVPKSFYEAAYKNENEDINIGMKELPTKENPFPSGEFVSRKKYRYFRRVAKRLSFVAWIYGLMERRTAKAVKKILAEK